MRYFSICALTACLVLAGCAEPVGREAKVGRLHRTYADTTRTDWANAGPRPLATTIWYRAPDDSTESDWRVGVFRFGRNARDAPFADAGKRPLVILSHGTGGSAAQLSWLAEGLVEAGYLVAGVNHHGNTAAEEASWPHGFALPAERARDISALIDRLLADEDIGPRIDADRIGAAGFSIGGYSALASAGAHLKAADRQVRCESEPGNPVCVLPPEAGFTEADLEALAGSDAAFQEALVRDAQPVGDSRIRAVYAIAPAFVSLMTRQDFSSLEVPTRIVLAENDEQILLSATRDAVDEGIPDAEVLIIPGAGHYAFLASCSLRGKMFVGALCKDAAGIDRDELHGRIGRDAAKFFDATL